MDAKERGPDGHRREPYGYTVAFDDAIAAGGAKTVSLKINDDAPFVIDHLAAEFRLSSASGQAVAGTPLARAPYPGSTNVNQLPTLSLVRMQIKISDRNLFNDAVRASLVTGTGDNQAFFGIRPVLPAGETVRVTIYNDSAVAIKGDVLFMGAKKRKSDR